jgi:MinD-like ATPase involved in chromosome partitioning or flagellar assembly
MAEPFILRVSSQKGGVGKTSVSVNLSVILSLFNYRVLLVDADSVNPSVGFHLGLDQANIGYKDVVKGKAPLMNCLALHGPTGMRVLPGTISAYSFIPTELELKNFTTTLKQSKFDFVVLDTSPGFTTKEPLNLYNEALLVTTPDTPSCTSMIRMAHVYTEGGLQHNMVINKVTNKRYEFSIDEIEDMYEKKALAVLPMADIVPSSISSHIPAYLTTSRDPFSRSMKGLARRYTSRMGAMQLEGEVNNRFTGGGIIGFIKRLIGIR